MKKTINLLILFLLLTTIFTGCSKKTIEKNIGLTGVSQSTWLWEATEINSLELVKNLKILGINELYVNVGWEPKTSEFYLKEHPLYYAVFMNTIKDDNIKTHALLSDCNWALSSNYNDFESQVKTVLNFNTKYKNEFSSIHLDIEPYLLEDWDNNIEEYLSSYVDNIEKIKKLIDNHNVKNKDTLQLSLDIPFWFSQDLYKVKGVNIIDLLLKYADELNIMAYTQNQTDFVDWATKVLDITDNYPDKSIKIAVELQEKYEDITLYNFKAKDMIKFLKDSLVEFKKYDSFKGLAIHDYKSYIDYVQKETKQN